MFEVMKERCNQCLYGPNKIVSNERRKEILNNLQENDDYFVCHKATINGQKIACGGDWEQRRCGKSGRMAQSFGILKFVEVPDA